MALLVTRTNTYTPPSDIGTTWAVSLTTIVSTASEMLVYYTRTMIDEGKTYTQLVMDPPQIDVSWPPLTTQFIPPDSCTNRYYTVLASPKTPIISSEPLEPEFSKCQANGANYTFSPGMCPENLQTATGSFNGSLFTEICCQSGFSWDPRGCSSLVTGTTQVRIIDGTEPSNAYTAVSNVVAVHNAVTIFWRSEDLNLFPADVSSARSVMLSSSAALDTSRNSTSSGTTKSSADLSLSLPARIGVGVGVTLGALLITIAISAWLCRVRRRRRHLPAPARNGAKELDGAQPIWKRLFGRQWRAELPQDEKPAELETACHPAELTGLQIPAELPGSYYYLQPANGAGDQKFNNKGASKKTSPGDRAL